jgi:hypothetical protein
LLAYEIAQTGDDRAGQVVVRLLSILHEMIAVKTLTA